MVAYCGPKTLRLVDSQNEPVMRWTGHSGPIGGSELHILLIGRHSRVAAYILCMQTC